MSKCCGTCQRKPDYRTHTCKSCSPNYNNHDAKENDMTKAVIYARVSTHKQNVEGSWERQVNTCTAYADKHGMQIIGIFKEVANVHQEYVERTEAIDLALSEKAVLLYEAADRWGRKGIKDSPPDGLKTVGVEDGPMLDILQSALGSYCQQCPYRKQAMGEIE